jgi:hypothetical protein
VSALAGSALFVGVQSKKQRVAYPPYCKTHQKACSFIRCSNVVVPAPGLAIMIVTDLAGAVDAV